jgi:hypothetical protein
MNAELAKLPSDRRFFVSRFMQPVEQRGRLGRATHGSNMDRSWHSWAQQQLIMTSQAIVVGYSLVSLKCICLQVLMEREM